MDRYRLSRSLFLSVVLVWLSWEPCHPKTWTSKTGKFKVEASFVALSKGVVVLRRDDVGKQIRIPLAKLHVDDQKWVMEATGWGRFERVLTARR